MGEEDAEVVVGSGARSNYATDENLSKRQSIFAYLDAALSSGGLPIERLALTGRETVADIGCGNGIWLSGVAQKTHLAVGLDLSYGMLQSARVVAGTAALLQADAHLLPLASGRLDGVLAMHMLYHLADLPQALSEIRRLLKPNGWLLATTNSGIPTGADILYRKSVEAVLGQSLDYILPPLPFDGENGAAMLGEVFSTVEPAVHVAGFSVTEPSALIGPLDSVRGLVETTIGRAVDWDAADQEVTSRAAHRIKADGAFVYQQRAMSFICRP